MNFEQPTTKTAQKEHSSSLAKPSGLTATAPGPKFANSAHSKQQKQTFTSTRSRNKLSSITKHCSLENLQTAHSGDQKESLPHKTTKNEKLILNRNRGLPGTTSLNLPLNRPHIGPRKPEKFTSFNNFYNYQQQEPGLPMDTRDFSVAMNEAYTSQDASDLGSESSFDLLSSPSLMSDYEAEQQPPKLLCRPKIRMKIKRRDSLPFINLDGEEEVRPRFKGFCDLFSSDLSDGENSSDLSEAETDERASGASVIGCKVRFMKPKFLKSIPDC